MLIKSKLTEKDYINVIFVIASAKKFRLVIFSIFFLIMISGGILSIIMGRPDYSQFILAGIVLIIMPGMIYFVAKKGYSGNPRVSETIEYQFGEDMLIVKGETFNSQLTWDKIPKVTLTKNWLLIWQTKQTASAIPRRDVWDGEIHELKGILTKHRVRNNLP